MAAADAPSRVTVKAAVYQVAVVVVAYGGKPCEGEATIGFHRRGPDLLNLGAGCSRSLATVTAEHELGHVLGLSGTPDRCREHSLKYWLAHPLAADDLRGLRAIYGS